MAAVMDFHLDSLSRLRQKPFALRAHTLFHSLTVVAIGPKGCVELLWTLNFINFSSRCFTSMSNTTVYCASRMSGKTYSLQRLSYVVKKMHSKICSKCKKERHISNFVKNRTRKDGYMPSCRDCERIRNAKYYQKNKERLIERSKKYHRENSMKTRAHGLVNNALLAGWLKRPKYCSTCNNKSNTPIEAHHPDYLDPFRIVWLCSDCHKASHNSNVVNR